MSACKHYNTEGYYRCALKLHKPCHDCGQFDAADDLPQFTDNTIIGAERPTVDTAIPDSDAVHSPAHYKGHYPFEVTTDCIREVLLSFMATDLNHYEAYCLGNELKYRLRAGLKGDAVEDIAKAMEYAGYRREG
jgi:hypothetical protein